MKILRSRKVINLADFFYLYEAGLKCQFNEKKADAIIAKTKTSLLRYVLPEYGFPLKLDGNLSAYETIEGLKLMKQIPIYQAVYLLESQERVFEKFGDRASSGSRRVYRSALKKMQDWGKAQDWWKQSVATSDDGRTPTMLIPKKRVEHWHKLKPEEISPNLSQQLDKFSNYLTTVRQPRLSENSCIRYRRELLGPLGWLHRVKGVALANLSLTDLVPVASVHDPDAAERVTALVKEYLEWMYANLGGKNSTLRFALQVFLYLTEYTHYEHTNNL